MADSFDKSMAEKLEKKEQERLADLENSASLFSSVWTDSYQSSRLKPLTFQAPRQSTEGMPQFFIDDESYEDDDARNRQIKKELVTNNKEAKTKETNYPDGSKIERDSSQRISKIEYSDKTACSFERDKNGELIAIKEADGSVWNKKDKSEVWVNERTGEERNGLSLSYEGVLNYKDSGESAHSIDRTGVHKATNKDKSVIEERNGLIQKLKRADGSSVDFHYDNRELIKVTLGKNESYSRPDGKASEWAHNTGGKQHASVGVEIHPDGSLKFQRGDIKAIETVSLKGSGKIEYESGASVEFLPGGKVSVLNRPNNSHTEFVYKNGNVDKINETYNDGKKAVWYKEQGKWRSMEQVGRAYDSYTVSHDGVISIQSDKSKYLKNVDGTQTAKHGDGITAAFDAQRRLTSVTRKDCSSVQFEYEISNSTDRKASRIIEQNSAGKEIWQKNAKTGDWTSDSHPDEQRRQVKVGENGHYGYVAIRNGQVSKIQYPDGNSRSFERNDSTINKVIETVKSKRSEEKGNEKKIAEQKSSDKQFVWQRREDSDSWESGSIVEERKEVSVSSRGEYCYVSEPNKKQCYTADDREHAKALEKTETADVAKASKSRIMELMNSELNSAADIEAFKQDLELFQSQAALRGVSDDQLAKTYQELSELIGYDGNDSPLTKTQRIEVAKQAMHHLAHPRAIDQGWHNTCNVATIQVVTACKNPEEFAGLIRQVASTGQYETKDRHIVKLDPGSFKADFESSQYNPYDSSHQKSDGLRSLASQIFQVTAVNAYYVSAKKSLRYQQQDPANPRDNGERLLNPQSKSVSAREPQLFATHMAEIGKQISGVPSTILSNRAYQSDSKLLNFSSEKELRNKIDDLQSKKNLPAILVVFTQHEPFSAGPGCHVVTVWGMDKAGNVLTDNQWGKNADHEGLKRIPISKLYKSTNP